MKKTIKISLIVAIVATILVAALLFGGCQTVRAEDAASAEQSEFAKYFEEKIFPLIGSFVASLIAMLAPMIPIFKSLKTFKRENKSNNDKIIELAVRNDGLMLENTKYRKLIEDTNTQIHKLIEGDEITRLNCPCLVGTDNGIDELRAVYKDGEHESKAD